MNSLKASFEQRNTWINTRASTIFPYFSNVHQSIVFQDYWAWKSQINDKSVTITVRDSTGSVVHQESIKNILSHNNYLVPAFLCENGMIEIEILSDSNIKFPFPAVMMFVTSRDNMLVSCVHSGGRILNNNEPTSLLKTVESNFLCRLDSDFTPFFHVFNGPEILPHTESHANASRVELCSTSDNTVLHTITYKPPHLPYSSTIYKLTDLLNENNILLDCSSSFYLRIHVSSYGIFPRLICGNFHNHYSFPFVTHSFRCYDNDINHDIQKVSHKDEPSMFFPICCSEPLDLQVRSYPTNEPLLVHAKQESQQTKEISESTFLSGSNNAAVTIFDSNGVNSIVRTYGSAPSRLNCSLNYSLPNSLHPTDIATGFKCIDYPPKHSHWGHAIISKQFDTLLFIRWIELPYNRSQTSQETLTISLFNQSQFNEFEISIVRDQITSVNLSDFFRQSSESISESIVSWRFITDIPTIECFWVSFNVLTGAIAGEHGF